VQRVVVTVSDTGYSPAVVRVKAGVPTELTFRTNGTQGCTRTLVVPSLKVGRQLPASGDTTLDAGAARSRPTALPLRHGYVLWHHRGHVSAPVTATFVVTGMHCPSCGMLIDEVVEDVAGVVASATSVQRGRKVVTHDPTRSTVAEIAAAIVGAGSGEARRRQPIIPASMTTTQGRARPRRRSADRHRSGGQPR